MSYSDDLLRVIGSSRFIQWVVLLIACVASFSAVAAPLIGIVGVDEAGYPTQHVDQVALLQALDESRFGELNQWIDEYQMAFENDYRYEYWPVDAMLAFRTEDPATQSRLDDWVRATPDHFAPYAARGSYLYAMGYYRIAPDGADPEAVARERSSQLSQSAVDLQRAVAMRPEHVPVYKTFLCAVATFPPSRGRAAGDIGCRALPMSAVCGLSRNSNELVEVGLAGAV